MAGGRLTLWFAGPILSISVVAARYRNCYSAHPFVYPGDETGEADAGRFAGATGQRTGGRGSTYRLHRIEPAPHPRALMASGVIRPDPALMASGLSLRS